MTAEKFTPPTLDEITATAARIAPFVRKTPTFQWSGDTTRFRLGDDSDVYLKLELFQRTGTFKARGAVNNALALTREQKKSGITTISAGNHAVAAAYAAYCVGTSAKVIMQASANPARVAAAKSLGAEVILAENALIGFEMVDEIVAKEGRTLIHAFEGPRVTEATATCGQELHNDVSDLEAVVVPVGAGGLCSGIGTITKLLHPDCKIYAVEPEGATVMTQSLAANTALTVENPGTIADSLAPPLTTPYCFSMCQQSIDEVVLVSDDELAAAVAILFDHMKLAVEPAAAATTAAAFGPLREKLQNKRCALVICGSNIDPESYLKILARGKELLDNGILSIE